MNGSVINGEFRSIKDHLIDTFHVNNRYVDLLVIPRGDISGSKLYPVYMASDILMGASCPVLVLHEGESLLSLPLQRVMLGWDGSQECARALRLALSMLTNVESVDVVSVSSSNETEKDLFAHHSSRY